MERSIPAILCSLFGGDHKAFLEILESRQSSKSEYISHLTKIVALINGSNKTVKFQELNEFVLLKRFLITEANNDAKCFGLPAIVKALLSNVLYIPACIQYNTDQGSAQAAYVHDLSFGPGRSATVSYHLDDVLRRSTKFKQAPSPALIVHINRENSSDTNMVLPTTTLFMRDLVAGETEPNNCYNLSAIVCDLSGSFCAFARLQGEDSSIEWKCFQNNKEVIRGIDLENQLLFWRNMAEFSGIQSVSNYKKTPIYKVLTSAVILIYVPQEKEMLQNNQSSQILVSHSDSVLTPRNPDSRFGTPKGIEGDQNSCFIDTLLMSWFGTDPSLRTSLVSAIQTTSLQSQSVQKIVSSLSKIIEEINQPPYLVVKQLVWVFRHDLSTFNESVLGQMMDVGEFVSTLFKKALNFPYFIEYDVKTPSGVKSVGNNLHQLITHSFVLESGKSGEKLQKLFDWSMKFQNLQFNRFPSMLMIKMPRSAGVLVGHEMIFPDPALSLGNVMCKQFQNASGVGTEYSLQAIICLEHMHYTAYLKCCQDSGTRNGVWVHFNSMGSVGPEMELVEGFAEKLQALSFDSNSNLPNSESHLYKVMKNIFLVVYTPFGDYVDDEIHSHITGKRSSLVESTSTTGGEKVLISKRYNSTPSHTTEAQLSTSDAKQPIQASMADLQTMGNELTSSKYNSIPKPEIGVLFSSSEKKHIRAVSLSLFSKHDPLRKMVDNIGTHFSGDMDQVMDHVWSFQNLTDQTFYFPDVESTWKFLFSKIFKLKAHVGLKNAYRNSETFSYYHKLILKDSSKHGVELLSDRLTLKPGEHKSVLLSNENPLFIILAERNFHVRKIIPDFGLDLSQFLDVVPSDTNYASLSSLICEKDEVYNVYTRTTAPPFWNHWVVLKKGSYTKLDVPKIEDFFRNPEVFNEKGIKFTDPAAKLEFDLCKIDFENILQHTIAYIYIVKPHKTAPIVDQPLLDTSIDIEDMEVDDDNVNISPQLLQTKIGDEAELNCQVALPVVEDMYKCFAAVLYATFRFNTGFASILEGAHKSMDSLKNDVIEKIQRCETGDCMELIRLLEERGVDFSKMDFKETWALVCKEFFNSGHQHFLRTMGSEYFVVLHAFYNSSVSKLINNWELVFGEVNGFERCVVLIKREWKNTEIFPDMGIFKANPRQRCLQLFAIICQNPLEIERRTSRSVNYTTFVRRSEQRSTATDAPSKKYIWHKRTSDGQIIHCPNLEKEMELAEGICPSRYGIWTTTSDDLVNEILTTSIAMFYSAPNS